MCKFGRSNLTLRVFTRYSLNSVIGLGEGGYYLSVVNVVFVNILCCTRQKASRTTGLKGSLWCTAMLHISTAVESNLSVTFAAVLTTLTLGVG